MYSLCHISNHQFNSLLSLLLFIGTSFFIIWVIVECSQSEFRIYCNAALLVTKKGFHDLILNKILIYP